MSLVRPKPSGTQVASAATDRIFAIFFDTHNTDGVGVAWQKRRGEGKD
jgi:hypothetical protein